MKIQALALIPPLIWMAAGCGSLDTARRLNPPPPPIGPTQPALREATPAPLGIDATDTAIVVRKYAEGTQAALTFTALPTATETATIPAIPPDSPPCAADALTATYLAGGGAMQAVLADITIANVGTGPCYVQAWPNVVLLDEQGRRIDFLYNYYDWFPPQAYPAPPDAMVGLLPGWKGGISLMIRGVCGGHQGPGVTIRLILMAALGQLDMQTPCGVRRVAHHRARWT